MAETIPFHIRTTNLRPIPGLTWGRDTGGLQISSRRSEPYWSGTFTSPTLEREVRSAGLAWLDDCVDLNRRVDYVHPFYKYPIGYDSGTWPMGLLDATLVSVPNLRTIVVSGMTVGIVLRKASRFCIIQGNTVCYRRITADVVVSSAITQSLSVGPRLPPGIFAPGATVKFAKPFVRLLVVPDSWDAEESSEDGEIEFEAVEALR